MTSKLWGKTLPEKQRNGRSLWFVVALAMSVAACASRSADDGGADPLPVSALLRSTVEMAIAADQLRESSIVKCMKERGFVYTPVDRSEAIRKVYSKDTIDSNEVVLRDWYGFRNLAIMETVAEPEDPNEQLIAALDSAQRLAYVQALNVSTTDLPSCTSEGERIAAEALFGESSALLSQIAGEVLRQVDADSAVGEARRSWLNCFRQTGFVFISRNDILVGLKRDLDMVLAKGDEDDRAGDLAQLQDRAAKLAKRDVICDEQSGLQATRAKVLAAAEAEVAQRHPTLLRDVAEERQRLLAQLQS